MIGQSGWYEASEDQRRLQRIVTVGLGDCKAGCIDRHMWTYSSTSDGTVELVSEEGDEVEMPALPGPTAGHDRRLAWSPARSARSSRPRPGLRATIGGQCRGRGLRPAGARGRRGVSDADGGSVRAALRRLLRRAAPVEGLMGTPEAQAFSALGGDQVGCSSATTQASADLIVGRPGSRPELAAHAEHGNRSGRGRESVTPEKRRRRGARRRATWACGDAALPDPRDRRAVLPAAHLHRVPDLLLRADRRTSSSAPRPARSRPRSSRT